MFYYIFWNIVTTNCGLPCNWQNSSLTAGDLTPGTTYHVISIATNTANLGEGTGSGNSGSGRDFIFAWDPLDPDSALTVPADGAILASIPQLLGTAFDLEPGGGIPHRSSVTLSIQEIGPSLGAYWNGGSTFTLGTEQYFEVDTLTPIGGGQYTWVLNTNMPTLVTGKTYRARVLAVDGALPNLNTQAAPDRCGNPSKEAAVGGPEPKLRLHAVGQAIARLELRHRVQPHLTFLEHKVRTLLAHRHIAHAGRVAGDAKLDA